MIIGEQIHIEEGLEALHMRIMNVVIVINLVPVEEVMMKGEVQDMMKVGSMETIGKVLLVLKLSMIGVGMIGLGMEGDMKIVEYLMEIQSQKGGLLSNQKI